MLPDGEWGAIAQLTPTSSTFVVAAASTPTIHRSAAKEQEQERERSRDNGSRISGRTSGERKAVSQKEEKRRLGKAAGATTIEMAASSQVLVTLLMLR